MSAGSTGSASCPTRSTGRGDAHPDHRRQPRVARRGRGAGAAAGRAMPTRPSRSTPDGGLLWRGGPVGRLVAGETMLAPRVEVLAGDFLDGEARERVRQRLQHFVKGEIERRLAPLFAAQALPLDGAARGLAFQLVDALGCIAGADAVAAQVKPLDRPSRRALARLGVRFGTESDLCRAAARPDAVRFRALLWAVRHGRPVPPLPGARSRGKRDRGRSGSCRRRSTPRSAGACWAGCALRPDRLERLAAAARGSGPRAAALPPTPSWPRSPACRAGELRLRAAGARLSRPVIEGGAEFFVGHAAPARRRNSGRRRSRQRGARRPSLRQTEGAADSLEHVRHVTSRLGGATERAKARLDQWLWFARFVKTPLARRAAMRRRRGRDQRRPVQKAEPSLRVGDVVVLPQGGWQLTVRVLALGTRRGPADRGARPVRGDRGGGAAARLWRRPGRRCSPMTSRRRLSISMETPGPGS